MTPKPTTMTKHDYEFSQSYENDQRYLNDNDVIKSTTEKENLRQPQRQQQPQQQSRKKQLPKQQERNQEEEYEKHRNLYKQIRRLQEHDRGENVDNSDDHSNTLDISSLSLLSSSPRLVISEWEEQKHLQKQQTNQEELVSLAERKFSPIQMVDQCLDQEPHNALSNGHDHDRDHYHCFGNINRINQSRSKRWYVLSSSYKSLNTKNPIRDIVDPILQRSRTLQHQHMKDKEGELSEIKPFISLALGDPTAYSNPHLLPCPIAYQAIADNIVGYGGLSASDGTIKKTSFPSISTASYIEACGLLAARRAIASYHTNNEEDYSNVVIANGCSGALELLFTSFCDTPSGHRTIVLLPNPGFPLYQVIIESHTMMMDTNTQIRYYPLLSNRKWEIDLLSLENILRHETMKTTNDDTQNQGYILDEGHYIAPVHFVLLLNNPSNPTGVVYSRNHLVDILRLCNEYHVVVITDEIYGDLTFPPRPSSAYQITAVKSCSPIKPETLGNSNVVSHLNDDDDGVNHDYKNRTMTAPIFIPLIRLLRELQKQQEQVENNNKTSYEWNVPIVTASGLSKQFLIPGWRIGWIMFHDNKYGTLQEVYQGVKRLSQVILGSSHLIQAIIPRLLSSTVTKTTYHSDIDRVDRLKMISWKEQYHETMYQQMTCLCHEMKTIPGLSIPTLPNAAMYTMVKIHIGEYFDQNIIKNDIDFTRLLYEEENVLVLPGSCFFSGSNDRPYDNTKLTYRSGTSINHSTIVSKREVIDTTGTNITNENNICKLYRVDVHPDGSSSTSSSSVQDEYFFRIVFCAPCEQLMMATDRMRQFCKRHKRV